MFHPLLTDIEKPERMNNPFNYEPHPLCQLAAEKVIQWLESNSAIKEDADQGKMFGVLVVETDKDFVIENSVTHKTTRLGFIAAYSGLLAGHNDWPQFVPPVFDAQQPDGHFKQTERKISEINKILSSHSTTLSSESSDGKGEHTSQSSTPTPQLEKLYALRKQMSEDLQLWLFHQYRMLNARGEEKDLVDIWHDYHTKPKVRKKYPLPPGGSGDCCAPKLLQYAYQHQLHPVCMAEFWWGASPKAEIRHHLQYYPACRGKCLPILTWMLQGLDYESELGAWGELTLQKAYNTHHKQLQIVYEDEWLSVVVKPANLLTIPGREVSESVMTLMRAHYPDYDGPLIVHRLDMATSGLLIISKDRQVNTLLQQQFERREVKKKYVALLEGDLLAQQGESFTKEKKRLHTISLPLRSDPLDRPRQVVDWENGKTAVTEYKILGVENGHTRVALYPQTGRTHQLRVHCAHHDGLNCPILGDGLYGHKANRLYLHAAELWFTHPVTGKPMHISAEPEW